MSYEHQFCLTVTFSDLGYAGLFAIAFIDMKTGKVAQADTIKLFSGGKLGLSSHSGDHTVSYTHQKLRIAYSRREERRRLLFAAPDILLPNGQRGIDADITLVQPPQLESLNIATSWSEKRTAFYLNEKVNCLSASGTVRLGADTIILEPHEAFGVLDWGRGNWTYINRWYWASLSGRIENSNFGLNLGYGFSDRSAATENAIIYNNRIHKLDEVVFDIPKESYLDPWKITSNDGRCELQFKPVADRSSQFNLVLVKSIQHQVFGYFSGTVILDDGSPIQIESMPGFAEDVYNRY